MEDQETDINHDAFVKMLSDHLKSVDSMRMKRKKKVNDYERKIQEKLKQNQRKHQQIEFTSDVGHINENIIYDELEKEELSEMNMIDDVLSNDTTDKKFMELASDYMKEIKKKKKEITMDDAHDLLIKYREKQRQLMASRDASKAKFEDKLKQRLLANASKKEVINKEMNMEEVSPTLFIFL